MKAQEPDALPHIKAEAASRAEELWEISRKFMLRRSGSIIESELPPNNEYIVFLKITPLQEKIYLSFLGSQVKEDALQNKIFDNLLGLISMLRKIANHPELVYTKPPESVVIHYAWEQAMKLFPDGYKTIKDKSEFSLKLQFVLELSNLCTKFHQKLLVVSNFTKTLDIIENHFDLYDISYTRLDGTTPYHARMRIVNEFNNENKHTVLLLSSKAGGCGLNLIGASRLIMFDND